jgi:hypothetical protein
LALTAVIIILTLFTEIYSAVAMGCFPAVGKRPVPALAKGTIMEQILNEQGQFSCLSEKETKLYNMVNQFRKEFSLPPIPNSRALDMVARVHAVDLYENKPEKGMDSRGKPCNKHSWSDKGFWTPVCYTEDHCYAKLMWEKPREIAGNVYTYPGFENVYWTSAEEVSPKRVIAAWAKNPGHCDLILESGIWRDFRMNALGVAIYKNIAIIWIGEESDSLGPLKSCN